MFRGNTLLGRTPADTRMRPSSTSLHARQSVVLEAASRTDQIAFILMIIVGYMLPTIGNTVFEDIWWTAGFAYAAVGLFLQRKQHLSLLRRSAPMLVLLLLAVISTLWSSDPQTTLRRSIALVGCAEISFWSVTRLGLKPFLNCLAIAITGITLMSLLLILFVPSIGNSDIGWQGAFSQKNELGQAMVIGMMTLFCIIENSKGLRRTSQAGAITLMAVMLLGSKSGTSVLTAAFLAILIPSLLWARRKLFGNRKQLTIALLLAFSVVALISTVGRSALFGAVGKDDTLTSRTDVWEYAGDAIAQQPLLGYGYKVFWLTHGGLGKESGRDVVTWATQAHNGFIETGLDLGYVGIVVMSFLILSGVFGAAKMFWQGRGSLGLWPLILMVAVILTNLAEANYAKYYDVTWLLFVSAFFFAADGVRERATESAVKVNDYTPVRSLAFSNRN